MDGGVATGVGVEADGVVVLVEVVAVIDGPGVTWTVFVPVPPELGVDEPLLLLPLSVLLSCQQPNEL